MAYREFFPWLVGRAGGFSSWYGGGSYAPEAVQFHGDNSHLYLAGAANLWPGSPEFTISFFFRRRAAATNQMIVRTANITGSPVRIEISVLTTGKLQIVLVGASGGAITGGMSSTDTIPIDADYHLVQFTYNATLQVCEVAIDGTVEDMSGSIDPAWRNIDQRAAIFIGAKDIAGTYTLDLENDIKGLWVDATYQAISTISSGAPVSQPLIHFDGGPTAWNYGEHSGTLASFLMRGRGVDHPYDVNKIAFRKVTVLDDVTPASWNNLPAAPDGDKSQSTDIAANMPRITAGKGLCLSNTAAGPWEGYYRTLTLTTDLSGLPINFLFHSNRWGIGNGDIRITMYHNYAGAPTAFSQYLFDSPANTNSGDMVCSVSPDDAVGRTVNTGYLPENSSVTIGGGGAWLPASGIDRIEVEFRNLHSYYSYNRLGATSHAALLGITRGLPFTPTIINVADDGRNELVDSDGTGFYGSSLNTFEYIDAINAAGVYLPMHVGVIAFTGAWAANKVTLPQMQAAVANGNNHVITHGEYHLDYLKQLDVTYTGGGGQKFVDADLNATLTDTGAGSGRLAEIVFDSGVYQTLLLEIDTPGATDFNTTGAISGGSGVGTYAIAQSDPTSAMIQLVLDRVKNWITDAGFNAEMAKHYVYPQGAYRYTLAMEALVMQALEDSGFKTARTTAEWTSGGYGKIAGTTGEVGIDSFKLSSYGLEDRVYHMVVDETDYANKALPYLYSVGGIHIARWHSPVVGVPAAPPATELDVDDLFTFLDAQAAQVAAGDMKCLTMEELYSQVAAHMKWTLTKCEDYAP